MLIVGVPLLLSSIATFEYMQQEQLVEESFTLFHSAYLKYNNF